MPNNIPDFQIANFLATNTQPLQLTDLSPENDANIECTICHNPFADPPQDYVHPDLPEDEDE
ncbi:hypothetical protein BU25DRAFT_312537, partial [Macroventuria anomochaeta]